MAKIHFGHVRKTASVALAALGTFMLVLSGASCSSDGDSSLALGPGGAGCRGTDQCPFGCDPSLGCLSCQVPADCAGRGGPICVQGDCVGCGASTDCNAGQACFPATHECRPACQVDSDCG